MFAGAVNRDPKPSIVTLLPHTAFCKRLWDLEFEHALFITDSNIPTTFNKSASAELLYLELKLWAHDGVKVDCYNIPLYSSLIIEIEAFVWSTAQLNKTSNILQMIYGYATEHCVVEKLECWLQSTCWCMFSIFSKQE